MSLKWSHFSVFNLLLVHYSDIVLMSKKHCHKYRCRSNPVSSHFLSLYSNYNNIIKFFDRNEKILFHQSWTEHRNKTFRMPKSKEILFILLFQVWIGVGRSYFYDYLLSSIRARAGYHEVMFKYIYNRKNFKYLPSGQDTLHIWYKILSSNNSHHFHSS